MNIHQLDLRKFVYIINLCYSIYRKIKKAGLKSGKHRKTIDSNTINQLIKQYNMETKNLPTGTLARKKIKSTQVQIYRSKIMFQGKDAEQVASEVLKQNITSSPSKATPVTKNMNLIYIIQLVVTKQEVAIILAHSQYVQHTYLNKTLKY